MKPSLLFLLPLLLVSSFFVATKPAVNNKSTATGGSELFDLVDIKFATGLKDWKNKPIDSLLMNIFYPTGATSDKKYPVILNFYGGGFSSGTRTNISGICDLFADEGFVSIAPNYRAGYNESRAYCADTSYTRDDAIYRAIQDINSCLRFIVAHADEYHIDTSKIFIGGSSAGADLAMYVAYISDSVAQAPGNLFNGSFQRLGTLESTGNTLTNTFKIKGVLCMWGTLSDDKLIDTNYRAIPVIMFKGGADKSIPDSMGPFQECANYDIVFGPVGIVARMAKQHIPCVSYLLSEGNHSAYDDAFCSQQAGCFFRSLWEGNGYSGSYTNYNSSCR